MKFYKTRDVKTPTRGTSLSAGIDFYIPNDFKETTLKPNENILIPSGIKVNILKNYCLLGVDKSGVATKKELVLGAKLIDEDYQGEIHIHLFNIGNKEQILKAGDKVAQFVLIPINYVDIELVNSEEDLYSDLSYKSERGDGGFGSTN